MKANADPNNKEKINLKGVAIGNGLTDVENQFGTYAAFASAKGLISATAASGIQAAWLPCKLGEGPHPSFSSVFVATVSSLMIASLSQMLAKA